MRSRSQSRPALLIAQSHDGVNLLTYMHYSMLWGKLQENKKNSQNGGRKSAGTPQTHRHTYVCRSVCDLSW